MSIHNQRGGAAVIIILLIAIGAIWYFVSQRQSEQTEPAGETVMMEKDMEAEKMMMETAASADEKVMEMTDEAMMAMKELVYDYEGELLDVTDAQPVRQTSFDGNSSGVAKATFGDGAYSMMATFENLPEPQGGDFYEGWIVRKTPFHFISTGELDFENGEFSNTYMSEADLTDHDFYVLTIEPDDGDPAPAEHVVEGTMMLKN